MEPGQVHLVEEREGEQVPGEAVGVLRPERADWVVELLVLGQDALGGGRLGELGPQVAAALSAKGGTSWPDASYLAPLHPVLDWAADRALSELGRGQIFELRRFQFL